MTCRFMSDVSIMYHYHVTSYCFILSLDTWLSIRLLVLGVFVDCAHTVVIHLVEIN